MKKLKFLALFIAMLLLLTTFTGCSGLFGFGNGEEEKDSQKTAYEIAVENGFEGTLEEWIASLVGPQGGNDDQSASGALGIGVVRTYVNSADHLIFVLTNGAEIDVGYVGLINSFLVTFNWNCDDVSLSTPVTVVVNEGDSLNLPRIPVRENYEFVGWYTDAECRYPYDFTALISGNMTLYACWRAVYYDDIIQAQISELANIRNLNNGELPVILMSEENYTPAFILGTYSSETVTDFDSAVNSLKDVNSLMGFNNVEEEYDEVSTLSFEGTTQYRMQQTYNGFTVYGQELVVTAKEDGSVTSLSGDYASIGVLFDPTVNISVDDAVALIPEEYGEFDAQSSELVVYTLEGYNEMAYVFDNTAYTAIVSANDGYLISVTSNDMSALPYVINSAHAGTITQTWGRDYSEGYEFNTAYYDYTDGSLTDVYIFYDTERNIVYHDLDMSDVHDWDYIAKIEPMTDSNTVWDGESANKAIALYKNLSATYDFYLNVLGLKSYDGNEGQVLAYVNDGYDLGNNAYNWGPYPTNDEIVGQRYTIIAFGGNANLQNNIDIVAHEYTHALQGSLVGGLQYKGQTGALMEAYADVMGELIEASSNNGYINWENEFRNMQNPTDIVDSSDGYTFPDKVNGVGYYELADVHHNSTVISYAIYSMYANGINDINELTELLFRSWGYLTSTASFYDYRLAMLAAASDMGLSDEKITAITDAFNYANITPETLPSDYDQNLSTANLDVTVLDAVTGEAVPTAHVVVRTTDRNNSVVADVYCNENGYAHVDLRRGNYEVSVVAVGYETQTMVYNLSMWQTDVITVRLISDSYQDEEVVCAVGGHVVDATNGEFLEGATLVFRKGHNITSGDIVTTLTTDANGYFETYELEYGFYTVEVSKQGYITFYETVQAAATNWEGVELDNALSHKFMISPYIQMEDALRIVLRWGEYPSDLDSHIVGPRSDGSDFHVYYSDKYAYDNEEKVCELDIDDTSSYGPETVTLKVSNPNGVYSYYVHDFTNMGMSSSTNMAASSATVQVYSGNSLLATYSVDVNSNGTLWHVFDYDAATGQITVINEYSYHSDSTSLIGSRSVNY